jgi:hypothetical protein
MKDTSPRGVFPARVIEGMEAIMISPKLKKARYGAYREAWELLTGVRAKYII